MDVRPEAVSWLWPGRIARGKVHLIDGDPGVTKSTLALDIAARISSGRGWPDGTDCPIGDVLLLSAEDGLADTVRPRLDAARADTSRVHAVTGVPVTDDDTGEVVVRPVNLSDVATLEEHIRAVGAVLVVVDVLMAYLPSGIDSHRDQDVRRVLARVTNLAERNDCAFLFLRHLNKGTGPALYRGGGSIGITGAARLVHLVGRDPEDPDLRVLAIVKSNIAVEAPSLTYRLVAADNGVASISWEGPSALTADELTLHQAADEDPEEAEALSIFIRQHVIAAGGEASASDVRRAVSRSFGEVSRSRLYRARVRAGLTTRKPGMREGWLWQLPERSTEGIEDPTSP